MNKSKAIKYSKDFIIADGHIDLPYRLNKEGLLFEKNIDLDYESDGNFDIPKAKRGGLDSPFMSIYIPSDKSESEAYEFANSLIDLVENIINSNEELHYAYSPSDVIENFNKHNISLPMGMENGSALGNNIDNLKYFFDRGIRYITLTHAKSNQICDSSYDRERKWGGLSDFGKKLIEEMNNIGMMIDVSHVSDDAFFDIMKISKKPVIASHSSPRALTPGFERNLSDEMIELISQNNGVVLINFGSSFVNSKSNRMFSEINNTVEKWRIENKIKTEDKELERYKNLLIKKMNPFADIEDVLDAIDHVNNLVGDDHIGFGSDYDGLGNTLPNNLKDVSTFVNLIEGLIRRGYSKESIEKICYKNFFRVWNSNLQNHQI
tara:strand:+ start:862 stop:1995 length:1134 start_codon:yes stop_codon:yes gene_type:complete